MSNNQVIRVDNPPKSTSIANIIMHMDALREITSRYANMRANIIQNAIHKVVVRFDSKHRVKNVSYLYSDAVNEALRFLEEQESREIEDLYRRYNIHLTDF